MQAQGNRSEGSDVTHTVKVIAGGFALLAPCLLVGRLIGGPSPEAGYTVAEEAPIFLLVFQTPRRASWPHPTRTPSSRSNSFRTMS
jgi:hypothetical protein